MRILGAIHTLVNWSIFNKKVNLHNTLNNSNFESKGKEHFKRYFVRPLYGNFKGKNPCELHLFVPKSLEYAFTLERKVESKNMVIRSVVTNNYRECHHPSLNLT